MPNGIWGGATPPPGGFGIACFSGLNVYVTDSIAVGLTNSYISTFLGGYYGSSRTGITVQIRLGDAEPLGERPTFDMPDLRQISHNVMYARFVSLYWASLAAGGYVYDDRSFNEGEGVRIRQTYRSDGDAQEIEFTRSLLRINSDGSHWWRIVYALDDDEMEFEVLVDSAGGLTMVRYLDPETGEVVEFEPDDPDAWSGSDDASLVSANEFDELYEGSERIRVPAGSFRTDRLHYTDDEIDYTWWINDDVPGTMVKYEGTNRTMDGVSGELIEILVGQSSPWGAW
jgi:hypothetical protein